MGIREVVRLFVCGSEANSVVRIALLVRIQDHSTVKPLYSGHPWDVANWLLYKGGLIIRCTFNREVLFGTLLGGCFREASFLHRLRYGCFRRVSLYINDAYSFS